MSGINKVESKIITLRNQFIILDSDVAELYNVETKHINQAVANNPDKFIDGYVIELNKDEWANLKSKILTSSWGGKNKLPKAFTEKGLYMLATILKSKRATETTIEIVETFAQMRELSRTVAQLADETNEETQKSLMRKGGELITDLFGRDRKTTGSETSIEFNLAMVKVKHSIKQETQDITTQLKTAKDLLDAGALTKLEFEKLKQKLLA
jgi:hypothetical protein